jgi:5-methylcytosine-specific restriction endonuclease McrA
MERLHARLPPPAGVKPSPTARGYDAAWQRLRLVILERDEHRCRWCGGPASTVDHVRPLVAGGQRLDPANLVAACIRCNSRRGAKLSSRRARGRLAPGSGWAR